MPNTTNSLRSDLVTAICQVISSISDNEDDPDDKQLDMVVDLLRALFAEYYRLGRPFEFPSRH